MSRRMVTSTSYLFVKMSSDNLGSRSPGNGMSRMWQCERGLYPKQCASASHYVIRNEPTVRTGKRRRALRLNTVVPRFLLYLVVRPIYDQGGEAVQVNDVVG